MEFEEEKWWSEPRGGIAGVWFSWIGEKKIGPSTQVEELTSDRQNMDYSRTQIDEKAEYRGANAGRWAA